MNTEMIVLFLNYSTDNFQKTISAENDPAYTEASIGDVFLPPGEYRVIAGRLMRVREGLPPSELQPTSPAIDRTPTS